MSNKTWLIGSGLVVALVAIPLVFILVNLFNPSTDAWEHIVNTVLSDYIINSLKLVVGVALLTLLIGVSTAWLVANYNFPARKWFNWMLILPLTIPSYIIAYTYVGIFEFTGPVFSLFDTATARSLYFDIMTPGWLTVLLALVLYPYVYVAAKAAFAMQSAGYIEAAQSLGVSKRKAFFKVALPLARPAIIGGVLLVIMEVLNDYGAAKYFGVNTFTTGIFKTWFSLQDIGAAIKLAAILLVVVFTFVALERLQRGKAQYTEGSRSKPLARKPLAGGKAWGAFFVCLLPLLFGFFIPVAQLLNWSIGTAGKVIDSEFIGMTVNSFLLALSAAAAIVCIAILIIYTHRINKGKLGFWFSRISVIGYAIPGAIIAVGVMVPFAFIDRSLGQLVLTGTVTALLFAYVVRFLAVGYNPIDGGFQKLGRHLDESAQSLGSSSWRVLLKVNLPLLKTALFGAAILVFVDVLKELPLTLILRPFNFDTLATYTFELASDENLAESANSALIIIATGIIPIYLLNRLMTQRKWQR